MIRKLSALPLLATALLPLACTQEPPPTPEEKIEMAKEESAIVPEGDPTTPLETLPPAQHKQAAFMIEAGERVGIISVPDVASGEADKATWTRLAIGANGQTYDMRVEYLGHGEKGDLYSYTIYKPYPEASDADPTKAEEVQSGEIEFNGQDILIYDDQENGVHYHLAPLQTHGDG